MNVPEFVRDPSENIYEQVADHIAARIAAGSLPVGSMLPNERELAAEYGVAVGTARKATELLEQRGLIKIKRSKGKFVLGQGGSLAEPPKPERRERMEPPRVIGHTTSRATSRPWQ